jgi:hypothetical protein
MKKTHLALLVASGLLVIGSANAARVIGGSLEPVAQIVSIADGYQCDAGNYAGCFDFAVNVTDLSYNGNYEVQLELPTNYYKYISATPGGACVIDHKYGALEVYTVKYVDYDVVAGKTIAYFTPLLNGKVYSDNIPQECYGPVFNGVTFYTF